MITAPLPRASPSGTGRLSMIIPRYYGLTITYIPSNTFTPVEERVLNRIKYYPRSLDFMMIKSLP